MRLEPLLGINLYKNKHKEIHEYVDTQVNRPTWIGAWRSRCPFSGSSCSVCISLRGRVESTN